MELNLRLPEVAGQFYPENKKELAEMIDEFLIQAKPPKIEGDIFGLLLPHAALEYSGPAAACGFKAIAGRNFDTVIILGDSHYERFDGVSIWPDGAWETPLGKVEVDNELARTVLANSKRFFRRDSAHLWEHSVEIQLPFLQRVLKNFKILPIVFGSENKDWELLAEVIVENIKNKRILIIASADLSHYLPYQKAKKIDSETIKNILNLRTNNLDVCAIDSAKTLIEITKLFGGQTKLLKYLSSADTADSKAKVVGYGAVVFYKK